MIFFNAMGKLGIAKKLNSDEKSRKDTQMEVSWKMFQSWAQTQNT